MKTDIIQTGQFNPKSLFDSLDVAGSTRKEYGYRIKLFLTFLQGRDFNFNTFLEFKRMLDTRTDMAVATKNKYLATARVFLKELHRRGALPTDITLNVKSFSQSRKHKVEGLSHDEMQKVVAVINGLPQTAINTRTKAIFSLLAFQGLRQIEVVRLDVEDLDLPARTAAVRGKGKDDKEIIHLSPETVRMLKEHVTRNKVGTGALFRGLGNRKSDRLSALSIKLNMKRLFKLSGIDRTTHGIRHYFITALLQKFDVRDVRKFSRHSNLEMLIVYDDEIDIRHKASEVFGCFKDLKLA